MDREKLKEAIRLAIARVLDFMTDKKELELLADHLIANNIGDITEWKHRADVAEEALEMACNRICDTCAVKCSSENCFAGKAYLSDYYKQQAEARLVELKEEK